ncbi:MAG: fumarate hydratase [Planctomycetes bacterium GWF2_41_51]|nr:MAG: fumarate hydratase [Planctomycetes bacterium GWF2_41_51]HBG25718.1 Fe-S-containing hydro-lyase [Phycisphaerales bacterium]
MKKIITPLTIEAVHSLKAGDEVAITGTVYTARDAAHKRLCEIIAQGGKLPIPLDGQVIYFVGPTPAPPGKVIGSAGPTTSARMDKFSPILLDAGLKGMIGKGYRGDAVRESLKKNCAVHFAALGGAGALLSHYIISAEVVAYEDLGTEAIRKLELKDFPAIVAYDCYGNSVFNKNLVS